MIRSSESERLDDLEEKISGSYDRLERNVSYCMRGICGELDLRAWDGPRFDYYEDKASAHPRAIARAYRQFARARRAFGSKLRACYIETPHGILGPFY